jgi:transcription antitermination protein NusB
MPDAKDDSTKNSPRRRARILALQALFEGDLVGHDPLEVVGRLTDEEAGDGSGLAYARHLVEGVVRERLGIDREISRAAPAWPIEQMPAVDKNLLRLAIYELLHDNSQVPAKAAINEAVEIAKGFGSESSSRFVNGVLGTVVAGRESRASSNRGSKPTEPNSSEPPVADR